jgi:hypothetical protein
MSTKKRKKSSTGAETPFDWATVEWQEDEKKEEGPALFADEPESIPEQSPPPPIHPAAFNLFASSSASISSSSGSTSSSTGPVSYTMKDQMTNIRRRLNEKFTLPPKTSERVYGIPKDFMYTVVVDMFDMLFKVAPELKHATRSNRSQMEEAHRDLVDDLGDVEAPMVSCQSFAFDQSLLVQSGDRPSPYNPTIRIKSPPCIYGERCIGFSGQLVGLPSGTNGRILMSWMTPGDVERHERNGSVPTDWYPCLLCMRKLMGKIFLYLQTANQKLDESISIPTYYNQVDIVGEYRKEVCHLPNFVQWCGLYYPVAAYRHDLLRAYYDDKGVFRVDQSMMMFTREQLVDTPLTPAPYVGPLDQIDDMRSPVYQDEEADKVDIDVPAGQKKSVFH